MVLWNGYAARKAADEEDGMSGRTSRSGAGRHGDVGRRIADRRAEVGLDRGQAAERAGVAPSYLAYVEENPADVDDATLLRIAAALDTTLTGLRGGEAGLPPGRHSAAVRPVLEELPEAACWELLGTHGIGRVARTGDDGLPEVLPVNYSVLDGAIALRTSTARATELDGRELAFEVDRVDEALREGWSVLTVGMAERVTDAAEEHTLAERAASAPWAGGDRLTWLLIRPWRISGRRITAR